MIDEKKLVEELKSIRVTVTGIRAGKGVLNEYAKHFKDSIIKVIEEQPKVCEWISITYHETTDDDGIDKEQFPLMLDCTLPEDDTEIIVCAKNGSVFADTFFNDDGCYLESGFDIIEDIIAWMPLPEPYKGDE